MTVWSVFLSMLGYVPFSITSGLSDLDAIRDGIFVPLNFVLLNGYTLAIGIVFGVVLKVAFRRNVKRGSAWDYAIDTLTKLDERPFCIVYTENGLEYKGALNSAGIEEERKELIIKTPKLILRDKDWNVLNEIEMGQEMLFTEGDIRRVLFFNSIE